MESAIQVFISYRNAPGSKDAAEALYTHLNTQPNNTNFKVFWDTESIPGAYNFDDSIYQNIDKSHVLILILTPNILTKTGKAATWIQREIDYARGCRVPILPILVNEKDASKVGAVLTELGMPMVQYKKALMSAPPSTRYTDVLNEINSLVQEAPRVLGEWVDSMKTKMKSIEHINPLNFPAEFNQKRVSYTFGYRDNQGTWHNPEIHLATGNIIDVENVDVLVNSENNYMQMGRIFDYNTVSSIIRFAGAQISGSRILDDRIQRELNLEVKRWNRHRGTRGTPIDHTQVLVTSAGHSSGELVKRRFRFIFHVASVIVNEENKLQKLKSVDKLRACVMNCLEETRQVDDRCIKQGQKPIESIIFPLLGTGTGGANVEEATDTIINGIKDWLKKNPGTALRNIYLSAYVEKDAKSVEDILKKSKNLTPQP